jgi:competence protein ComFC
MVRKSGVFGLNNWINPTADLMHLIFPRTCVVCEQELSMAEKGCCSFCIDQLPFTHFEKMSEPTPLDQLFWGRVQIEQTFSLLHYEKGSAVQEILHRIKYGNDHQLAMRMGRLMAQRIKVTGLLKDVDALLPVPVHHQKRFIRGYNQSEMLAEGFGNLFSIPIEKSLVQKTKHTGSQTNKNRFLRWDNVSENFLVGNLSPPKYQHYAIIDDVITTGSTIEAMINALKQNYPELRFSILSLAVTK